jgi:hypothetical protein
MDIKSKLTSGQIARLIPSISDSKKEEKATSIVLAAFMAVPDFASKVLDSVGVSVGKRTKVECFTEVGFADVAQQTGRRPDGLIVVTTGKKVWTALVESKIGRSELQREQVESYLVIAKQLKIDCLITVSNQFTPNPAHHPIKVSAAKTRSVGLFHFSWLSIKSTAAMLVNEKGIADPDQAYLMSEVVRYLDSDSSGVEPFSRMPPSWKDLCSAIQNGATISKNSDMVLESVGAWHQLLRQLSLDLGLAIGESVAIGLTRENLKDPETLQLQEAASLRTTGCLSSELSIPNAASKLSISADVARKVVFVSMKLAAPKDTKRATASINWLVRQLKSKEADNLSIRAYWPRRMGTTIEPLDAVRQNPAILVPEGSSMMPTFIEVCRVIDLGARFKGAKTFVEDISDVIPSFYEDAGQQLTSWVAKAPKVKEKAADSTALKPVNQPPPTIFSELFVTDKL